MVYSVGRYADDPRVRDAVLDSDRVRREALKRCYRVPGYARLPREEKNKIYDRIREEVKEEQNG